MVLTVLDKVDNYTEFLTVNELEDELRNLQRKDLESKLIKSENLPWTLYFICQNWQWKKKCSCFWISTS